MSKRISGGAKFFFIVWLICAALSLIRFLATTSGGDRTLAGVSALFFLAAASTIAIKPAWFER